MPREYTPRLSRVCDQCQQPFTITPSDVKKGGGRFCSWNCRRVYGAAHRTVERVCRYCGTTFQASNHVAKRGLGIFCSGDCARRYRYGDTHERFWNKVQRGSDGDCWLWNATVDKRGYGKITFEGRVQSAHRVSWMLNIGPIPTGLEVCHRCDVPACVNPAHLFVATHYENMMDRDRKGRHKAGEQPNGEEHWFAKLTEDEVREIRANTTDTNAKLAKKYSVAIATISGVRLRRSWKHVS